MLLLLPCKIKCSPQPSHINTKKGQNSTHEKQKFLLVRIIELSTACLLAGVRRGRRWRK